MSTPPAGGRRQRSEPRLRLDGLLAASDVARLRDHVEQRQHRRLCTEVVDGAWARLDDDTPVVSALLSDVGFRRTIERTLSCLLPDATIANSWLLHPGDSMRPHRDSPHYVATISIGLTEGAGPDVGGAIAFGTGDRSAISVEERWYPRAGDVVVFRPSPRSWHQVEPVTGGQRRTVTAWWVDTTRPDRWDGEDAR